LAAPTVEESRTGAPLAGLRVIDLSTIVAGPLLCTFLADFGADVIKVEHPARGDDLRRHGPAKNGVPLWWKVISRNKRTATLNLSTIEGQDLLVRLAETADVIVENFRPGTLERWNLPYERLRLANPGLVLARITGFGQEGPYRGRPGFGTIAEAMSGFAHITGQPDAPPTLPPFGLADGISALAGATAVMMALYHRDARGGSGQVIDLAIIEPILTILGPQVTIYDQLGIVPQRTGNRSQNNAPRNTYRTRDQRWLAVSTSSQSIAERVMRLVGHPEVIDEPWFASAANRARHADQLDEMVGSWIASRDAEDVVRAFEDAQAAVAPIYDVADVFSDPQYQALGTIARVADEDLGEIAMQNVIFRMSETPGSIRWAGRHLGQDNESVFGALGLSPEDMSKLREKGVV